MIVHAFLVCEFLAARATEHVHLLTRVLLNWIVVINQTRRRTLLHRCVLDVHALLEACTVVAEKVVQVLLAVAAQRVCAATRPIVPLRRPDLAGVSLVFLLGVLVIPVEATKTEGVKHCLRSKAN